MQPLRISFGHGVRIGPTTFTYIDLTKVEFSKWKYEVRPELHGILLTDDKSKTVLVPFGNIAYVEMKVNETRSENQEPASRTGEAGKGKARTA
jgi:hypothetical protein